MRASRHPYARSANGREPTELLRRRRHIHSFPTEILEKIFIAAAHLPISTDPYYPHRPLFSKAPLEPVLALSIAAVCRRWRHTAIQTQKIWSNLHLSRSVDAHRRLKSTLGRSLEWVATYLARSHDAPLHITLDTTRLPLDATLAVIDPLCHRWSSLSILVSHVGALPNVLSYFVHPRAPNLASVSIFSDIYREGIVSYGTMVPFLIHPTIELDSISLHGVYVDWNAPPFTNLTSLELRYTTRWPVFPQLKAMLDASPRLTKLVIHDDINTLVRNVAQPCGESPIRLRSLRYFEVKVHRVREQEANLVGFMRLFSLPQVETLVFIGLHVGEWSQVAGACALPRNPAEFEASCDQHPFRRTNDESVFPSLSTLVVRP